MAYDDRYSDRFRERGGRRWRGDDRDQEDYGRETPWRGDRSFGAGWGNQMPHPQRLGDRDWRRPSDDPYAGSERYGPGPAMGYGAAGDYGPLATDSDLRYGGPGFDASFGGPRFDRADVGSTGTHGVHPVSTAFGGTLGRGIPTISSARSYALAQRDPHYEEWRSRQIAELDRDYDEYRRENQSRFDREFGSWRERRGAQRQALGKVSEHMEVVGSDGAHVGTVDSVRGDDLVLTKSDSSAGGIHHRIPCSWVDKVEDKVILNLTGEEATTRWREDSRRRALFERPDSGSPGPHVLNRSFAGTYPDEE